MKNLLILLFTIGSMICTGQEENQKSFQNSLAIGAGIGYILNYRIRPVMGSLIKES